MILFFYSMSLFLFDFVQLLWNAILVTLQSVFRFFVRPAKVSLEGEVVLITGAGHGIGRELALEFAKRGAHKIVLWDINQEENEKTANEVRKEGGRAFAYFCDVSDRKSVTAVAQQVFTEVGNITILINNAGILHCQPFLKLNHQQMTRVMEINCLAHFWTLSEFLPRMMEMNHGHIVAIASISGKLGASFVIPYTTSKYAVTGMMESLTAELKELKYYPNIFTTTVFPTVINTGLLKNPRLKYRSFLKIHEPEEVARRVIDGIQRKEEFVYIPAIFELFFRLLPIIPRQVYFLIMEFLDAAADPQD